ncbi:MAG: gamma-glutamyl-gamma-aminobutyrate hydrolase family protein [Methanoregula sp.]
MILLVDLCSRPASLSRDEFVGPVARIAERAGEAWREVHFSEAGSADLFGIRGIILCGTALQDNLFSEQVALFAPLFRAGLPVLGICAGMQALCLAFGGSIRPACEIGMTKVRSEVQDPLLGSPGEFEAFELHSFACEPPPGWIVTAVSETCVQAVRHPDLPVYGVMFHPEVRNDHVVERFCALLQEGV